MLPTRPAYYHSTRPGKPYTMKRQLAVEARHKSWVDLLFFDCGIEDISASASERKSGTDFLLSPPGYSEPCRRPIRCENKFESMATGRQLFEWVSVDRPTLVPGWMVTSRAAWLLSWYPSAELVAVPMDELRALLLKNPARHRATSALNPTYLTWSTLEDINHIVRSVDGARVLDLHFELGMPVQADRMLGSTAHAKRCGAEALVELMRRYPAESAPLALSDAELRDITRQLAPKNYKASQHAAEIARLGWLGPPRDGARSRA